MRQTKAYCELMKLPHGMLRAMWNAVNPFEVPGTPMPQHVPTKDWSKDDLATALAHVLAKRDFCRD